MVTLTDIAEAADVSPNTVSRALQPGVVYRRPTFQKRAEHIRQLAEQMGYRPNTAARATREGRFHNVALLLSTSSHRSHLSEPMLAGIHDALAQREMSLTLVRLPDETLTDEAEVPKLLRERGCDGMLIDYTHGIPAPLESLIEQHQVPAIWLNTKRPTDAIYPDDLGAGRLAAEHLLGRGFQRIAYLGHIFEADEKHYSETDRAAGYREAVRAAGLEPTVVTHLRSPERIDWLIPRLAAGQVDAVVCYGQKNVGETVAAAYGARVDPADLGLTVFGDAPAEIGVNPTLVHEPNAAMGHTAVLALLEKIDRPHRPLPSKAVPFSLVP